ncbi:Protein CBG25953 [Caenorhabditis briggsae]|uniref:Protein CBG25953 n=1 Tax=Caenorhabditis briggsae TaxID=6238 RepID=B6IK85_CAEBR|nr:Protein CBG25953 [Caenorhabditis briggsae]CAS00315.1 Protein CBG25953 [Caenorhabditis briggsae]
MEKKTKVQKDLIRRWEKESFAHFHRWKSEGNNHIQVKSHFQKRNEKNMIFRRMSVSVLDKNKPDSAHEKKIQQCRIKIKDERNENFENSE